jgi:uncharacterized protein YjiK
VSEPVSPSPEPVSDGPVTDKNKKEKRRLKKLRKALDEAERLLDPWDRYRGLTDAFDMLQELIELADNKARFALITMGFLNAGTLLLGTHSEALALLPEQYRTALGIYVGLYSMVAVYYFLQAIETLRPRAAKPNVRYPGAARREEFALGLRFYVDVLTRDERAYQAAWRELHLGQLNAEVAMQAYALARINQAKYGALERLYGGLRVLTVMATLLAVAIASAGVASERQAGSGKGGKKAKAAAPSVLGEPARLPRAGAVEPSGITWHPGLQQLFVIGDEGSVSALSASGQVLWTEVGLGNLEDVVFHPPSGKLMLLSEKKSQLLLFDPETRRVLRKWKLDAAALLGKEPGDKNQGFEGLAFREQAGRPGGGLFYVAHQRMPSTVVVIAFDTQAPEKLLTAEAVLDRFKLEGFKDLTAATWVPGLDRLLVIADEKDRLLVVRPDGTLAAEVALPGIQQEGLCFDAAGNLWVADDRGGLLRFDGALSALAAHLRTRGASPVPGQGESQERSPE